jgi:hypothetical protein
MLNDVFIATTAVSSFNNAALLNPLFFSAAVLALPLFFMVYFYGRDFVTRFGWNNQNFEPKTEFWLTSFLAFWVLLFGGNYAVIRDSMSSLSLGLGIVLFLLFIVISNTMVRLKYLEILRNSKLKWAIILAVFLAAVCSGIMTWWGILLQISAILCGAIVGCRLKTNRSWLSMTVVIFAMMTTLILMQPEYFRFGQLGHLTLIHLIGIVSTGFFAITTLTTKYTNARSKIYQSAFIKLKWLLRIIALLAVVLFVSTESVPVFIGLLGAVGLLEALSIYHDKKFSDTMFKQSWAMMMICFGIIIICPVISALGIVYLTFIPNKVSVRDFMRLL